MQHLLQLRHPTIHRILASQLELPQHHRERVLFHSRPGVGMRDLLLIDSAQLPPDAIRYHRQLLVIGFLETKCRSGLAVEVGGLRRASAAGPRSQPIAERRMKLEELPIQCGRIRWQPVHQ